MAALATCHTGITESEIVSCEIDPVLFINLLSAHNR